jgi:hypothetical protein
MQRIIVGKKGKSGSVRIEPPYVFKHVTRYLKFGIFENEVKWLNAMQNFDRVPKLIEYDLESCLMKMTYVGTQITKKNVPGDWERQVEDILVGLKRYLCAHNDIKPREIMVLDSKLHLIDFGWANQIGSSIPKNWPPRLGSKFKLGVHDFDDKHSLYASIRYVLDDVKSS